MTISILRLIIALLFIVCTFPVFADSYPHVTRYKPNGYTTTYPTKQAACDFMVGVFGASYGTIDIGDVYSDWCRVRSANGNIVTSVLIYPDYSCPYGGTDNGTNCIDVPPCTAPLTRNSSGECVGVSFCTGTQMPITSNCKYPTDKGIGIDCSDGTTVYVPSVCASTGTRWQDVFPAPKPMCSPLNTDHTNCTPTIFQRFDDFASSHAIQYATAAIALMTIPELAAFSSVATGVAVEAKAVWDGVFHNSAGEIVDVKVAAEVPSSTFGQGIIDFFKSNPTSPYATSFPEAYNGAAPQAPIVVEPNTGVVHPADSTIPLSPNQVAEAAKHFAPTLTIPYAQIAPFITPERIPWLAEAPASMQYDMSHMQSPINYPTLTRTLDPIQSSSPYYQISPNPLETAPLFSPATPASISTKTPFTTFSPASPQPISAPTPTSSLPPTQYNPNPTGTDAPTTSITPPNPVTPIDPGAPELPPIPPEIFPDTWKYFDWLPMANPFSFDVHDFIPSLPEPVCYYEIHRTFHVPLLGNKTFDLAPCVPLQPLRTVLAWVFSVLTLFTCFFVIFRSSV